MFCICKKNTKFVLNNNKINGMNQLLTAKLQEIEKLCKQYKVHSLYVFGSVNTNSFNAESDIDFLIAFEKDLSIEEYTDNYFEMRYSLRDLFNRDIDLVTENSLSNPYFIQSIEQTKQLLYAA
ncbi:nucleotidyltransferase domain-containing protein [Bacteroidales bacterium OttesenSCG-928-I21]|nr:nucleotidyltransferase domain-containing protein [Bacteroidales bacterium OttesenSCG-928-I21]